MRPNRNLVLTLSLAVLAVAGLTLAPMAGAGHGDIHARCDGDRPVITQRPPGTEHVKVICRGGLPEFVVEPAPVPTYDPIVEATPRPLPPDFGGWVTVWLNGRPLVTPYDPIRGVQEPGAYVAASTGRVMMPVRFFTEAFGGEVDWHHGYRRARLTMRDRNTVIQLWIGKENGLVNARVVPLDQRPVIFLDRMFVPVRFLIEGFGAEIDWNQGQRSARIQMDGAACVSEVYCGEVR